MIILLVGPCKTIRIESIKQNSYSSALEKKRKEFLKKFNELKIPGIPIYKTIELKE
jgi:hypothetical protein